MDRDKLERDYLVPLFRFAWALTGTESAALKLTYEVLADDSWLASDGVAATEVAVFTCAYRCFTEGRELPVPPSHSSVALLTDFSKLHAGNLTSDSFLKSFRELELPQRAALVLFYTSRCSVHDIAAILERTTEEAVAIIARGKAEWLHILHRPGN